jgi:hypothetical protein
VPMRTPHDWDDVDRFVSSSPFPCAFMLGLVRWVRERGLDDRLAPLFSHGTVSVFLAAGSGDRHLTVYRPVAGAVRIDLLEGTGAERRVLRTADVPEPEALAAFEDFLNALTAAPG